MDRRGVEVYIVPRGALFFPEKGEMGDRVQGGGVDWKIRSSSWFPRKPPSPMPLDARLTPFLIPGAFLLAVLLGILLVTAAQAQEPTPPTMRDR